MDNTELPASCCGLAGNFGFEREQYDVSVAAAEQVLLPHLRAAAEGVQLAVIHAHCEKTVSDPPHGQWIIGRIVTRRDETR